jgi:hypothetical protein
MNIFKLLRNPLIKIIGVGIILYFGLLHDKHNPDALGNRLAPDVIKNDLSDAREKGKFIISNVALAKQIAEENEKKKIATAAKIITVSTIDISTGFGEDKTACGDIAEINYEIFTDNPEAKKVAFREKEKLILGNKENEVIENNIINLSKDAVRDIKVPADFNANNPELKKLLETHHTGLRYHITILSFIHNPDTKLICK